MKIPNNPEGMDVLTKLLFENPELQEGFMQDPHHFLNTHNIQINIGSVDVVEGLKFNGLDGTSR